MSVIDFRDNSNPTVITLRPGYSISLQDCLNLAQSMQAPIHLAELTYQILIRERQADFSEIRTVIFHPLPLSSRLDYQV